MPTKASDYVYTPSSLVRKPARRTGYDQTQIRPNTAKREGKLGGLGSKVSGGTMNGGGKRRPSSPRI